MQAKVLSSGFRDYDVIKATAVGVEDFFKFYKGTADRIVIHNMGEVAVAIRLNKKINPTFTVPAKTVMDVPVRTLFIFLAVAGGTGTSALEIIGYYE